MSSFGKSNDEENDSTAGDVAGELRPEVEKFDESTSDRFEPLPPEKLFVRGLIQVEFTKSAQSGVETWNFEENQRKEFSNAWQPRLKKILADHNLLSWKPSFPL